MGTSTQRQFKEQRAKSNMRLLYLVGTLMVAGSVTQAQQVGVRAPSRLTIEDCLCQCESQVFVDKFGRTNGNCKSTDSSGKRWCYLKDVQNLIGTYRSSHRSWNSWTTVQAASPVSTTCRDGRTSQQFQGKVYGYHACGTPELNSYECQRLLNGGGNNNCGSWNNYCNGNNNNNNCGSWNNYCNGNNGNNNCGSWNNYCRNKNSGGPLQQLLGQLNGGNGGRNKFTSTRNQSSKNKGGVSFVPQK